MRFHEGLEPAPTPWQVQPKVAIRDAPILTDTSEREGHPTGSPRSTLCLTALKVRYPLRTRFSITLLNLETILRAASC